MRDRIDASARRWAVVAALLVATTTGRAGEAVFDRVAQPIEAGGRTQTVMVPAGYRLELLSDALRRPRMLIFLPGGELLVGSRDGVVYRLTPPYDRPELLLRTGGYPHSVAWRDGTLLVARTDGLYGVPYRPGQRRVELSQLTRLAPLPGGPGHSSRTVRVGPDGRIYLSLGISGNCSDQYLGAGYPFGQQRGGVMLLDESLEPPVWRAYASGLRNPVDFDWQPSTGDLFVANNGPDHHGFEQPPELFSRAAPGSFHGMPWFIFDGREVVRDHCVQSPPPRPAGEVTLPVATFPARNAPLGVAFVPAGALDPRFEGDAVVALHGSWATRPTNGASGGPASRRPPKLVVVRSSASRTWRVDDLVDGFQDATGQRWLRPAGVAIGPDGALYFTSDAGVDGLYRLRRE